MLFFRFKKSRKKLPKNKVNKPPEEKKMNKTLEFKTLMLQLKTWIQFKLRVRVKHALARPRTPSHPLSPPRPKTPRPLPAVRPPGGLPTVHPISDPYPSHIKVRACFTLGVKHALSFFSCEKLRACFTQRGKTRPQAAMGLTWSL